MHHVVVLELRVVRLDELAHLRPHAALVRQGDVRGAVADEALEERHVQLEPSPVSPVTRFIKYDEKKSQTLQYFWYKNVSDKLSERMSYV